MKSVLIYIILYLVATQTVIAQDDMSSHAKQAVELGWQYFNRGDPETALKRFNQAGLPQVLRTPS